jgi:hypothetical protein
VVVAADLHRTDAEKCWVVGGELVDSVDVAGSHLLDERSTKMCVQELSSTANRQKRHGVADGVVEHRDIERILQQIGFVRAGAALGPVEGRIYVGTAGHEDAVVDRQPIRQLMLVVGRR